MSISAKNRIISEETRLKLRNSAIKRNFSKYRELTTSSRNKAIKHLQKGRVIIFGGGTGSPYFSTDTAASLRAAEINAEIILKASVVDGVYDCDPNENSNAKKFDTIPLKDVLSKNLKVMDMTAAAMCQDNKIPMLVFNINDPENIVRAVLGENIGTVVY